MNKLLLFVSIFISSVHAGDFCARSQADLKGALHSVDSRISFKNAGGLINGGVCWWHSRLQRSSAYLVKFRPELNPPTKSELKTIINSLRVMDKVIIIPGYSDFNTFSHDYKSELQAMLNDWQKRDGFFNFEWLRGISGRSSLDSAKMKLRMKDVYTHYKNSPTPLWIMAQIKGITSHSLLILEMAQTPTGYVMSVIDSNHPAKTIKIEYNEGDTALRAAGEKYTFVPYVGFQNDFKNIAEALKKECGHLSEILNLENLREGDVETTHLQY